MLYLVLIFAILFLLFILSWVWPPDSPWAPWWRTNKKTALAICKLAAVKDGDIVYDLGCGDGEVLITTAEKFDIKGVGIEIDPLRFIFASLRVKFGKVSNKVKIKRANFWGEDISEASIIIVYLVPATLKKLLDKFKKLKKGTKIVSYRYEIPQMKPVKKDNVNKLYLYRL